MVYAKVNLPKRINKKLKVIAAMKGITLKDLIYEIIVEYVNKSYPFEGEPLIKSKIPLNKPKTDSKIDKKTEESNFLERLLELSKELNFDFDVNEVKLGNKRGV